VISCDDSVQQARTLWFNQVKESLLHTRGTASKSIETRICFEQRAVREREQRERRTANAAVAVEKDTCAAEIINVDFSIDTDARPDTTEPVVDGQRKADTLLADLKTTHLQKRWASKRDAAETATSTGTAEFGRLSKFLFQPSAGSSDDVSSIFGLLRSEDTKTVESARSLLALENNCAVLKKEQSEIARRVKAAEGKISSLGTEKMKIESSAEGVIDRIKVRTMNAKQRASGIKFAEVKQTIDALKSMPSFLELEKECVRLEGRVSCHYTQSR